MIVNLHIERLIVDGLLTAGHDGPALGAAVEAEVTRQLTLRGLNAELLGTPVRAATRVPAILVPAPSRPADLGVRVGDALASGLGTP